MTAIFSTTWPAGSWSSTAATASPSKATTLPGSGRSRNGSPSKRRRRRSGRKRWSTSSSGSAWPPAPVRRRARPASLGYEELLSADHEKVADDLEIYIPPGPRLGKVVLEAEHLQKAFEDRILIDDLSFQVPPGAIVGVIGPNGAGKTTLLRMIVSKETPDGGSLRLGDTVKLGYIDQDRTLDAEKSVWDVISGGNDIVLLGKREVPSRAYVARFNFSGSDQQKRVKDFSGGERNRVHLARMLKEGANFLLLDEPTNDLDVNTLRALEEAILEFGGSSLVVSHDRWFLDRVATHILAFEGESRIVWFDGNYSDYDADRKRRLGKDAEQPHRIRYKKLTRS